MSDAENNFYETWRLQNVIYEYFDAVDAKDSARAAHVFTDDARLEIMTGKTYEGRERIERAIRKVMDHYITTSHHLTNFQARIDTDRASSYGYVYTFHRMRKTGEPWHFWGRLRNEFIRAEQGWAIESHRLIGLDGLPIRADIDPAWYAGHPHQRQL
jgi:uncharacterized protein (TIGR02246 family)